MHENASARERNSRPDDQSFFFPNLRGSSQTDLNEDCKSWKIKGYSNVPKYLSSYLTTTATQVASVSSGCRT